MKKLLIISVLLVVIVTSVVFVGCTHEEEKFPLEYDATTDYGVYWYNDGEYVRSSEDINVQHFDPSKPTFIFAHGWEPDKNNTTNGVVEDLVTHKDTVDKLNGNIEVVNYAEELKSQGYNVACLGWFGYANVLTKLFGYIWMEFDDGLPLCVRFAQELASVMGDYTGDITMVGHSYGAQVAVSTSYILANFYKNGVISSKDMIPKRLTLADPYINNADDSYQILGWNDKYSTSTIPYLNEGINGRYTKDLVADCVSTIVKDFDTAVDIYGGMSLAYDKYEYDGSDPYFEKLSDCCTFVKSVGIKNAYGDQNIHNIVRDWVLLSMVDGVVLYDQNGDVAPSGGATNDQIKALRGKCYYQVYRGFDLSKDSMELKDRTDGTY